MLGKFRLKGSDVLARMAGDKIELVEFDVETSEVSTAKGKKVNRKTVEKVVRAMDPAKFMDSYEPIDIAAKQMAGDI